MSDWVTRATTAQQPLGSEGAAAVMVRRTASAALGAASIKTNDGSTELRHVFLSSREFMRRLAYGRGIGILV